MNYLVRRNWFREWIGRVDLLLYSAIAALLMGPHCGADAPRTVCDYGAVGDGKSDDTAAIQRAVDEGAGDIRFPRGTYLITQPIVVELDRVGPIAITGDGSATIRMAGSGPAIQLIGTHEGTADPETVKENVWLRQRTPMVTGLEIVGAHPDAVGIEAMGTMQLTVSRVTIRRASHGIHLTRRNRNVILSDCHIYGNRGVGIYLDRLNLHQINITNCHISYNKGGGIVIRESEIRNLQIGVCDIEANMDADGAPTANILIDTAVGSVREGAIVGCTIQHSHLAPHSANIRFLGRSAEEPQKVGNFVIADNVLSDVGTNVHLKHARGVSIVSNTIWKGFERDLFVEESSNIVVGPNLFDRNPDYQPYDSHNGILFRDCADCTLTGLHLNGTLQPQAGLILERCRRFNITNCTILNCKDGGIILDDVHLSRIAGCLIHHDKPMVEPYPALRLTKGTNNMITGNLLRGECIISPGAASVENNQRVE